MQLLPGNFGGQQPAPVAPPPLPKRTDPQIGAARERQRKTELKRRGRASTVLTSTKGVKDPLGVSRPQAREATLLGG